MLLTEVGPSSCASRMEAVCARVHIFSTPTGYNEPIMMKAIACCFNWRVAAVLGAAALGILFVRPALFAAALPFLFLVLCPVSMLLMMRMMSQNQQTSPIASEPSAELIESRRTEQVFRSRLEQIEGSQPLNAAVNNKVQ